MSAIVISLVALGISALSLALSGYLAWRDRSRLKAHCQAMRNRETGEYSLIKVTATNIGRRPINLRFLWGRYGNGRTSGMEIDDGGRTLQEGEFHEVSWGKFDGMMVFDIDDTASIEDLYFEDSRGRHHKVKDARRQLHLLKESEHPFGAGP
jgi:hypothetical protein